MYTPTLKGLIVHVYDYMQIYIVSQVFILNFVQYPFPRFSHKAGRLQFGCARMMFCWPLWRRLKASLLKYSGQYFLLWISPDSVSLVLEASYVSFLSVSEL